MDVIAPYLPYLLQGVSITAQLTVVGFVGAVVVAFTAAFGRLSRYRVIRWPCAAFIEVFRGTSTVVQLFWFFFALPLIVGVDLAPFTAAVLVLALNQGAFAAETVRGSVLSVPKEQYEAATALSLPRHARFAHVILPQAAKVMVPALGNHSIDLLKQTALVSLITVNDLTFRAMQIRATTGETLAVFGVIVLLYLAMSYLLSLLRQIVERRVPQSAIQPRT